MQHTVTRLVVVRHGETAWNRDTRIQGHTDIPLNDHGHWQARRTGQALRDEGVVAVYSSDLLRAAHTAQAIAQACEVPLSLHTDLRERHFGRFEGLTHDEIVTRYPDEGRRWRERDPSYGPEGGETLQDFYERCVKAAWRLASQHPGETVALVAHGGVLDCFYRAATHVDLTVPRSWKIANASINRLIFSDQGFGLVGWADTHHLDESGLDEVSDGARASPGSAVP
jgi:probable phosphoglycerate mutase